MKYLQVKTMLSRVKDCNHWFGVQYNLNLYRGCSHGCIYCDSRSDCYRVDNFDQTAVKKNALNILEKELRSKRKKSIIGLGAMSDSYNPCESRLKLTRNALELMNKYKFGVHIPTKGILISRDCDILLEMLKHSPVSAAFTITVIDDVLSSKIEPSAPAVSRRLDTLKCLANKGFYVGILMMPILPFIGDTEENIVSIIHAAAERGASFIYPWFGITMRSGQREYFLKKLEELFSGMGEKYQSFFGHAYHCNSPNSKYLWKVFRNECVRLGIIYKMAEIIKGAEKRVIHRQLSLF
ncbi:SPL family radical SAM protein [Candidatus Contubernalis alkaliaceticus]|uniref:SPL family radical SAM protein n=1 Tax=Candidatus Contubernalis alkaliaceticus TaxID=338645 RepID=UPI001F4BDC39|nr:radical SAM protein [Candidatus Contubernalis alkalaceticus]UNC91250.1 radical SAM protein [Candidatus Contubernalis alkalaceticus]